MNKIENTLYLDIERVAMSAEKEKGARLQSLDKCYDILTQYKNDGGNQKEAYQTVHKLFLIHHENGFLYDLLSEVLETIVWFCSKPARIWDEYLST